MEEKKAQRSCVACGKKTNKRELIRIVRTPSNLVCLDRSGNAAGRGAYVCSKECFKKAVSLNRLSRTLRMKVDDKALEAIEEALEEDDKSLLS